MAKCDNTTTASKLYKCIFLVGPISEQAIDTIWISKGFSIVVIVLFLLFLLQSFPRGTFLYMLAYL